MADLRSPPLVGTYGRAGSGKTSDKIRAAPNALFLAGPGQLVPAITEVGFDPPNVEEISAGMTIDTMRSRVEARLKQSRGSIKQVVIDDFSMIAGRTERAVVASGVKDGRKIYGIVFAKAAGAFDEWRDMGITVLVDCHETPPEWKTDADGKELAHYPGNRERLGGPALPGRKSGPEMVKAFDMFYRVVEVAPPLMGGGASFWPFAYKAGPYGDGADWETKDRWGVSRAPAHGILPMNLGEVLRFLVRRHNVKTWSVPRAHGKEWQEPLVEWAAKIILAEPSKRDEVRRAIAAQVHASGKATVFDLKWVLRDIDARVEIERMHTKEALEKELGLV